MARGLSDLDDISLRKTIDAWVDILALVPTKQIRPAYQVAMRNHKGDGPFGAQEIYQAWCQMQRGGGGYQAPNRQAGDCPDYGCSQDGMITVMADDQPLNSMSNYLGHTYVKPCPVHRAQGLPEAIPIAGRIAERVGHKEAVRRRDEQAKSRGERVGGPAAGWGSIGGIAKKILRNLPGMEETK
jgi:hypothetical protein